MPLTSKLLGVFLLATPSRAFSRYPAQRSAFASRSNAFKFATAAATAVSSSATTAVFTTALPAPARPTESCAAADTNPTTSSKTFCSMSSGGFSSRSVDEVVLSREQREGVGAVVRRSIGGARLKNFDPFLLLDEFDVGSSAGFPDHPHRGFETVTYMLKGIMEHEDFCGHRGKIGPGSLQWMTAGKGTVHAEMPTGEERGHGLQLWVNLKSADKMISPAYQELDAEEVPRTSKDGVTAIVIAGEAMGITSPVYTRTPTQYIHFKMEPGSELKQPIPEGMNSFVYMLEGKAAIGPGKGEKEQIDAHNTITLTKDGSSGILVKTFESPADFVLISGEPTNEPVVQHGPFVMNTRQEIQQAMWDYGNKANGFEKAASWYSEIGLPMTHADRRR